MTRPIKVAVIDRMQAGYFYQRTAPDYRPKFMPAQMLEMAVFEGKFMNNCTDEFPSAWFGTEKLSCQPGDSIKHSGVKSR